MFRMVAKRESSVHVQEVLNKIDSPKLNNPMSFPLGVIKVLQDAHGEFLNNREISETHTSHRDSISFKRPYRMG